MGQFIPTKLTRALFYQHLGRLPGELPVIAYITLCDLGAHKPPGWLGSARDLTEILNERLERGSSPTTMGIVVKRLVDKGILTLTEGPDQKRFFLLGGVSVSDTPGVSLSDTPPVSVSDTPRPQKGRRCVTERYTSPLSPLPPLPPPPSPLSKSSGGESARVPAFIGEASPDQASERRRSPASEGAPDDGRSAAAAIRTLSEQLLAAFGGVTGRQVDDLVSEVGADEVAQQLAWWPKRTPGECSWARSPWCAFMAFCRQQRSAPTEGPSHPSMRPASEVIEQLEQVEACSFEEFIQRNPEYSEKAGPVAAMMGGIGRALPPDHAPLEGADLEAAKKRAKGETP